MSTKGTGNLSILDRIHNVACTRPATEVDMRHIENLCIKAIKERSALLAALKGLLGLYEEATKLDADPIEIGCHCTDTGDGILVCPWCKAAAALSAAEPKAEGKG